MGVYPIGLAGESFRNEDGSSRQDEIRQCKVGEAVVLQRDPDNVHDDLCVKVMSLRGRQIGNIPRSASWIAERLDSQRYVVATIQSIGTGDNGLLGVVLEVSTDEPGQVERRPAAVAAPPRPTAQPPRKAGETAQGCIGLAIIGGLIFAVATCSGGEETEASAAKKAADRQKGFHCLSGWDGSSSSLVAQIKEGLRDPESFEHDKTMITPNDGGKHRVSMTYRARNGFGGMNVATAYAEIDHESCDATILSSGE